MSLLNRVSRIVREAVEEGKELKEIGELKLDIRRLEGQLREAYQELGEQVFQRRDRSPFPLEELQEVFDKIDSLNRRIESKKQEIEQIKEEDKASRSEPEPPPEPVCPQCGAPTTSDMRFCSECGEKLQP